MSRASITREAGRALTGLAVGFGASLLGGILFSAYVAALAAATIAEVVRPLNGRRPR